MTLPTRFKDLIKNHIPLRVENYMVEAFVDNCIMEADHPYVCGEDKYYAVRVFYKYYDNFGKLQSKSELYNSGVLMEPIILKKGDEVFAKLIGHRSKQIIVVDHVSDGEIFVKAPSGWFSIPVNSVEPVPRRHYEIIDRMKLLHKEYNELNKELETLTSTELSPIYEQSEFNT